MKVGLKNVWAEVAASNIGQEGEGKGCPARPDVGKGCKVVCRIQKMSQVDVGCWRKKIQQLVCGGWMWGVLSSITVFLLSEEKIYTGWELRVVAYAAYSQLYSCWLAGNNGEEVHHIYVSFACEYLHCLTSGSTLIGLCAICIVMQAFLGQEVRDAFLFTRNNIFNIFFIYCCFKFLLQLNKLLAFAVKNVQGTRLNMFLFQVCVCFGFA